MSHHDRKDDHDDDHDDHHDDHDDEHGDLHLEMHRAADELGKYAIDIQITSPGIPKERIKGFITEAMYESTMNCLNNGADMVGHTKSFLICDDGNIMSSLVDETKPVKIKDSLDSEVIKDAKFILHVIVHGIWDDRVRELTLEVLPGIFEKWDIPYEVIADYYDLEKSIAHHL